MSAGPAIDAAPLNVFLDLRWPQSYLALEPAFALADELGVEASFLPIAVPPLKAPSAPRPGDDRGVRHRRARAEAIAREIAIHGAAQGLAIRDYYRDPDPAPFHLAWLWLRERAPERLRAFLGDAFRAYWAVALDPSDETAVASHLAGCGADPDDWRAWCRAAGPATARGLARALAERGIAATPSYLVDGEFFQGRQHLPMIRWLLEGRRGPGPI